ncbi:MAG: CPCC family cysteine-rich protein [Thermoanaerobaculia bacterium]
MAADLKPPLACPACGFLVFSRRYGSSDTCPVCHWVDDLLQLAQPDFTVGRNSGVSLRQAQRAVLADYPIGLEETGGFIRDAAWRPLRPAEHPRSEGSALASPVCYLLAPDPDTFEPYWLIPGRSEPSDL